MTSVHWCLLFLLLFVCESTDATARPANGRSLDAEPEPMAGGYIATRDVGRDGKHFAVSKEDHPALVAFAQGTNALRPDLKPTESPLDTRILQTRGHAFEYANLKIKRREEVKIVPQRFAYAYCTMAAIDHCSPQSNWQWVPNGVPLSIGRAVMPVIQEEACLLRRCLYAMGDSTADPRPAADHRLYRRGRRLACSLSVGRSCPV